VTFQFPALFHVLFLEGNRQIVLADILAAVDLAQNAKENVLSKIPD
jgi:hypothetical protein